MKLRSLILGTASILLLTTCAGHLKTGVASVPGTASSIGASDRHTQPRTGADMSFEAIISCFVYELLSMATENDGNDITAHTANVKGDPGTDRSGNSADRSPTTDPYRLRARATFRSPALPSALDPQR